MDDRVHLLTGHVYIMDDGISAPNRRRRHSAEFKAQVIQACKKPGVSIAATALSYQLNANLVRIWIRAHDQKTIEAGQTAPNELLPEFLPLALPSPVKHTIPPEIVIEVKRGTTNMTVRWPGAAAAECAQWLQNWLR